MSIDNQYSELTIKLTKSLSKDEKKTFGIFITPKIIIGKLFVSAMSYIESSKITVKRILEPSCGTCEIINYCDSIYKGLEIDGIEYNDKIWFIVHQQNTVIYDTKNYLHNFVVFDKNMNLLGYSNAFNFENKLVEFCIGMILYNNNFIITYSTFDKTTKVVVFLPEYVNSLITYI